MAMIGEALLPVVMNQALKEIGCRYKINNCFTDEDFLILLNLFGTVAEKALELVEKDTVKRIHLENSTRFVYQVAGSSNKDYFIFPETNYCQCPAYVHTVLTNRHQLTCKHVLACYLCIIMNKIETYEVNLTDFMDIQKLMLV